MTAADGEPAPSTIPAVTRARVYRRWEQRLERKYPGTRWTISWPPQGAPDLTEEAADDDA